MIRSIKHKGLRLLFEKSMEMFDPPHPGQSIRHDCIEPLGLSVTAAAAGLGISRQTLSELLNGRLGVSPEMALRLEAAGWGHGPSWLSSQAAFDLWQAKRSVGKKIASHVKPFKTPEPA